MYGLLKRVVQKRLRKRKIEEHVPRHIELTAVFNRDVRDKKMRVRKSKDKNKLDYHRIILKYTMKSLILAQDER